MEWTTVTVIIALVGLVAAIAAPCVKLASAVTKNTQATETLTGQFKDFIQQNHEAHGKLWEKEDEQDERLGDHETRISVLEHSGKEK